MKTPSNYSGTTLAVSYDPARDQITIEGIVYAGNIFRAWSKEGMPTGTLFRLRRDGLSNTFWLEEAQEMRNEPQ